MISYQMSQFRLKPLQVSTRQKCLAISSCQKEKKNNITEIFNMRSTETLGNCRARVKRPSCRRNTSNAEQRNVLQLQQCSFRMDMIDSELWCTTVCWLKMRRLGCRFLFRFPSLWLSLDLILLTMCIPSVCNFCKMTLKQPKMDLYPLLSLFSGAILTLAGAYETKTLIQLLELLLTLRLSFEYNASFILCRVTYFRHLCSLRHEIFS